MSIIAVEITKDKIRFAYDDMMNYNNQPYANDKKVAKFGNIIIGIVGVITVRPYLYKFLSEQKDLVLDDEYSVANLIDSFKKKYEGLEHVKFGEDESVLISDSKKVFYIKPEHYTCYEVTDFEVIGSGADFALGAYKANKDLVKSVEIAVDLNITCAKPIHLLEVQKL